MIVVDSIIHGQESKEYVDYVEKQNFWAKKKRPFAITVPSTISLLQGIVRYASAEAIKISVVGGGHSAHCLQNDCLAVDLSYFSSVYLKKNTITTNTNTVVVVGGGACSGNIVKVLEEEGDYKAVLGARPGVGLTIIKIFI